MGTDKFSTPRSHQPELTGETGRANRLRRFAASARRCGWIGAATPREIGWVEWVQVKRLDRRSAGFLRRQIWQGKCAGVQGFSRETAHGHVDVFEDLARSDAENSLERFNEVVPLAAAVLTAESIGEAEI